jgi:hypothetical protein
MRNLIATLVATSLLWAQASTALAQDIEMTLLPQSTSAEVRGAESEALEVMAEFMRTFNQRDTLAFAQTLTFPHVRVASGGVTVFPNRQTFVDATNFANFAKRFNWSHSQWDSIKTVQTNNDKVHFAVRFTRFNPAGKPYVSFHSLYILQRTDDGWGIRARSSFAP